MNNYKEWRLYYREHRTDFTISKIDMASIKTVHQYLLQTMLPGECGNLRGIQTGISGSEITPSYPFEIEDHLISAIEDLQQVEKHPIIRIIRFQNRFLTIHPFADGNGRVIRELVNNWLINLCLPYVSLPDSTDLTYRVHLQLADQNKFDALLDNFCSSLKKEIDLLVGDTLDSK